MLTSTLDSLSLKIHSFLQHVGVHSDPATSNAAALVSYFEAEYGLEMMGFLESEWLNEQLGRDERSEDFEFAREVLEPERRKAFDADVAYLLSR